MLLQNADGSYSYTPDANFNGADSFTYKVNDGELDSNIATVTSAITAVNDAPTLTDVNLANGAPGAAQTLNGNNWIELADGQGNGHETWGIERTVDTRAGVHA